jgi:hypothetical protein
MLSTIRIVIDPKPLTDSILPGSRGPEHQAASAVPQPTDNTYYGRCLIAEGRGKLDGSDNRGQEFTPITDFFNTHALITSTILQSGAHPLDCMIAFGLK